jgi:hypothetical protein
MKLRMDAVEITQEKLLDSWEAVEGVLTYLPLVASITSPFLSHVGWVSQ